MKLAVVALFVILSLGAVNANGGAFQQPQAADLDFEYIPDDNVNGEIEVEAFLFISIIKSSLRTVKGLNCSIKAVFILKSAAEQCLTDLKACGGTVSKQVQNVINTLNTIISLCNDIINLQSNICSTNGEDGNNVTTKSCILKTTGKMLSLYKNTRKCISLIKKVPTAGSNASACVTTSVTKVSNTCVQFPSYITNCSKLTSN